MSEQDFHGYMILGALMCGTLLLAAIARAFEIKREEKEEAKRQAKIHQSWLETASRWNRRKGANQ
jgi:hypothetical protein